jgi:hypothetical protein
VVMPTCWIGVCLYNSGVASVPERPSGRAAGAANPPYPLAPAPAHLRKCWRPQRRDDSVRLALDIGLIFRMRACKCVCSFRDRCAR